MSNVINVNIKYQQGRTEPLFQYDYGQVLKINGIELPLAYEVHFATSPNSATSITKIGNEDGVDIPDEILHGSGVAYAWLFLHSGENDGETKVVITIPIIARAKICDPEVTPAQEDVITQAIAALDTAVESCAEYALACEDAVDDCQNCIEFYPTIGENKDWWVYDPETGEMVDSGVNAKGYQGDPGPEGPVGPAPNMTVNATADALSSDTPTVTVTKSGTNTEPVYSMAFSGLKGTQGSQGEPGESSSIWYSTSAPVNYAGVGLIFYKSGLHGQTDAQKLNELIFYGSDYYMISELRETYVIVTNKTSNKGVDGIDGSHIWESTREPDIPDYTFYLEDLEGPDVDINEGDLIFYGDYYYSILSFNQGAALCERWVKIKGDKGDTGSPGDPTLIIDDTSTASNRTWSAEKLGTLWIMDISNEVFGGSGT